MNESKITDTKNEKWYRDKFWEITDCMDSRDEYNVEFFKLIMHSVLESEGGYVNDPKDKGGETNFGISKRSYPQIDIKNLDKHTATCIYFVDYWVANRIYELRCDSAQQKFLHMSILSGNTKAVKLLQRSAKAFGVKLDEDGIIGNQTLAFMRTSYSALFYVLKSEWANELRSLNQPRYIQGWLNRAYA